MDAIVKAIGNTIGGLLKPKTVRRKKRRVSTRRKRKAFYSKTPRRYGR